MEEKVRPRRVDDDAGAAGIDGLVDPVHQLALVVGLVEGDGILPAASRHIASTCARVVCP
jgi:hypothetical protein